MNQKLHVDIKDYDIEISDDKFENLMQRLDEITAGKKKIFVVSKKVYALFSESLGLNKSDCFILPDGEKEKNFRNYIKIIEFASNAGLTRNDVIVALGGGVVGDIAGFAASTFMRGINYIQVPTTLLSMVDSSVGGKTAVNYEDKKNIAGTFHQPAAVLININFLKTLDKKQLQSGLGEVLKYAFIENNCLLTNSIYLFEYLTLCCEKFFEQDTVTIIRIISYCLELKIAVVNSDEKESSLRKILNFGHTLGHALEEITKYRKFTHGEAVVYGMLFAMKIAYEKELINYSYYRLSTELLEKYGFKTGEIWKKYPADKLTELMKKDKKAVSDKITFILPDGKKNVGEYKFTSAEVVSLLK